MMNKKYLLVGATALGLSAGIFGYSQLNNSDLAISENQDTEISAEEWAKNMADKKAAKHNKEGYFKTMEASGYFKYLTDIRTKDGEKSPSYKEGYRQIELEKALANSRSARTEAFTFDERGPGNVAGRTRSILVDSRDASNNTWFMGTAGGGIWKTTDAGATWTDKSGNMAHLGITSLAQAASNPSIMYATTGETAFGNAGINGGGVFKSTNGGDTWTRLASTIPRVTNFLQATRVIVSPTDPNIVLVTSAYAGYVGDQNNDPESKWTAYVLRSTDGGTSWTPTLTTTTRLQQIVAEPGNFNNMYATGIAPTNSFRSTNAGLTWTPMNLTSIATVEDTESSGIGRSEIAISPSNPATLYASVDINGGLSRLLTSIDRGVSWRIVEEGGRQKTQDYMGGQGGYDNCIVVDPTNENKVYWGGVDLWSTVINPPSTRTGPRQFLGADLTNMGFLTFVNVSGFTLLGGQLQVNTPAKAVTVEIRFGAGKTQKAHRFVAGGGGVGPGVAASAYIYQDYVNVPFEVWDTENNQQLMFSFRDQQNDGQFTFTERNDAGDPDLLNTREYMFVHAIPYNATTPSTLIAKPAGHQVDQIYFVWPFLTAGQTFNPTATSTIRFNYGGATYQNSTITRVSDAYGNTGNNVSALHPDHHMLKFAGNSRLISVNDGGLAYSDNGGTAWIEVDDLATNNIVTSQYYKVDRHPTENRYVGGMQDNGSWVSPINPTSSSDHASASGGDGMEAVWHATDPTLVLTTSQNNSIYRSTDGGVRFNLSGNGLSDTGDGGTAPFVSRLGYSLLAPDVVFAVGASGVFKSTNFGQRWNKKAITNALWNFSSSTTNVYPSLADPSIVWAGSGMSEERTLFLSTNGGDTFTALPNPVNIGAMSGFATDPEDKNVAYMLFGQGEVGKVWRTKDLGQTWTEISGFGLGTVSRRGFPDVVPFSMVVWGDTLFVGTEIGLMASYNDGLAWSLVTEFPSVAIFSLVVKERDGQLVLGTHGRGAWSSDMGITYTRTGGGGSTTPGSLTISAISGTTSESGTTATFTVKLATAPTANVTVAVVSGNTAEGTVSPSTLTFTPANFATAQTVTVKGVDDTVVDGSKTYNVTLTATSTDAAYSGKTGTVSVTNLDNDVTGILNPTDAISLKVYPNPTQDWVRFELPKVTGNYDVRVYTITGQEVLRTSNRGGGNMELNIQKFVGGTYILKAVNGDKIYVQKVVLQK
jgi:hypothetical protein